MTQNGLKQILNMFLKSVMKTNLDPIPQCKKILPFFLMNKNIRSTLSAFITPSLDKCKADEFSLWWFWSLKLFGKEENRLDWALIRKLKWGNVLCPSDIKVTIYLANCLTDDRHNKIPVSPLFLDSFDRLYIL